MLDRDEIQDELILEAGRNNANPVDKSFSGIDLSKFVCVMRSHCSAEFLAGIAPAQWEKVAEKNYQPFLKGVVNGTTVYWEKAITYCPHTPQFGTQSSEFFWVPRAIARRLTGSLGANYANYGIRDWSIQE